MTQEDDGSSKDGTRKPRREAVQIYRPGFFCYLTKFHAAPRNVQKRGGLDVDRGTNRRVKTTRTSETTNTNFCFAPKKCSVDGTNWRSTSKEKQRYRFYTFLCVFSLDGVPLILSDRNDSGSTTPDAASICSERKNSWSRGGGVRTFTRGGGKSYVFLLSLLSLSLF